MTVPLSDSWSVSNLLEVLSAMKTNKCGRVKMLVVRTGPPDKGIFEQNPA